MKYDRLLISTFGLAAFGVVLQLGCASSAPRPETAPSSVAAEGLGPHEELFPQGFLVVEPGQMDVDDHYLASTMVFVDQHSHGGAPGGCSGVVIHPRLILTAGHCVCGHRPPTREDGASPVVETASSSSQQPGKASRAEALEKVALTDIFDARASCAESATIRTISYVDPVNRNQSRQTRQQYVGKVLIHPDFEIVRGRRTGAPQVVWSNADLAVVLLEQPLPHDMPHLELARAEVQVGDVVTMTGFSHGTPEPIYGVRYFGDNRVSRLIPLETGSVVFRVEEQQMPDGRPASHLQPGDSGGACIRKNEANTLVGIATIGAQKPTGERMSVFTSVYAHRGWLLQMLQKADES